MAVGVSGVFDVRHEYLALPDYCGVVAAVPEFEFIRASAFSVSIL